MSPGKDSAESAGNCPEHKFLMAKLDGMDKKLDEIGRRLGTGDVSLAVMDEKIKQQAKIVYGAIGFALSAALLAIRNWIFK